MRKARLGKLKEGIDIRLKEEIKERINIRLKEKIKEGIVMMI